MRDCDLITVDDLLEAFGVEDEELIKGEHFDNSVNIYLY